MIQDMEPILLCEEDYKVMISYLKGSQTMNTYNRKDARELENELKKATLLKKEVFPPGVVRLNSTVKVREESSQKILELTLVTPENANISKGKISILAPLGTALIGCRKDQQISWQVPGGTKVFSILEVASS
ncbi:MAG TPA: GreA/GreB family elongation factor [Flavisolibacter sp.]|nr:GreA/GreB family elongation factor [Flavisolibacter sp.]